MTGPHPRDVLFDGDARSAHLPVCDHYAGSEKLMRKSLALQRERAVGGRATFDVTLDCEDGAAAGREREHAQLVADVLQSPDNAFDRVGIRVHDVNHPAVEEELDLIMGAAHARIAYVTFPKIDCYIDAQRAIDLLRTSAERHDVDRQIPVHVLIESPRAVADVFTIAALDEIECLSFGLMDFVSAHGGAIPDDAMRSPGQFDHPLVRRAKLEISAACHAWGKTASHNVTTDFADPRTAAADATRAAREFGYARMWSIHPSQIDAIVSALRPSHTAIDEAAAILLAAQAADWGPIQRTGRLHDRASYRYYWSVLQQAAVSGAELPAQARTAFFGDA